jgi:diguanylate cyclase (GGDEF)-like protein
MKKAGLRFKILAGLGLISFCCMSLLILILQGYLESALEKQLVKRAVSIAYNLAEQSVNPVLTHTLLQLDLKYHEQLKNDDDMAYIFLINPQKQVIAHTFSNGFPVDLKETHGIDKGTYSIVHVRLGERIIGDIAVPVMDGQLGQLHVGMAHSSISREIREIILNLSLAITVFFALAAVILWLYLDRVALRPMAALGEQARLLGEGHFKAHTKVGSGDEIGMLGETFNEMGKHLDQLYSQMMDKTEELARANEQLAELATTDGLTGLYNHRHFYARLTEEVKRAKRYQHPLTMIMADIDLFKQYNDTLGHVAGDKALKIIAGLVSENARENDLVARYGGEELAIILPETPLETARLVAERMRSIIASAPELAEVAISPGKSLTMSFGVAQLDDVTDSAKGFVRQADALLYRAKQQGRNRVES